MSDCLQLNEKLFQSVSPGLGSASEQLQRKLFQILLPNDWAVTHENHSTGCLSTLAVLYLPSTQQPSKGKQEGHVAVWP